MHFEGFFSDEFKDLINKMLDPNLETRIKL